MHVCDSVYVCMYLCVYVYLHVCVCAQCEHACVCVCVTGLLIDTLLVFSMAEKKICMFLRPAILCQFPLSLAKSLPPDSYKLHCRYAPLLKELAQVLRSVWCPLTL